MLYLIFWNVLEMINVFDVGFLLIFRWMLNFGYFVVCYILDGGSEWKEGWRVSICIKFRFFNWWRGEKMLYGCIYSSMFVN